ncbi:RINT-1 family protein-like protein [Aaosphaeria arxii CBS 175.79]|uniref:RINT-1 family protein-like protein n=1 Tax=Aaosphaeria arxii CBS 175.79 TaxID=1450172 RepID=A0A6A5XHA4_9PLEO|nr:RINT-1 family protein-like protein [Aaosphaeria arxii CBS 175.79]KAF2011714.1 RINT-1 family protein-like protein [Aaosphaeria arxii CBS 175.79]
MDPIRLDDTRVADYLDDKLQTLGDLESLDELLANIHKQHGELKQQLHDAQQVFADAKQGSVEHNASLKQRSHAFNKDLVDIEKRLLVVTESETSEEATPRFEALLDNLHRLDVANAYLELLKEVDTLSNDAQSKLQTSNEAALAPYKQLRSLHTRLISLQTDAEGAAPQLLHHVGQITDALRAKILDALSADLETVLKKIRWPTPKATIPSHLQEEWEMAVTKLLDLQTPELEATDPTRATGDVLQLPPVLFPLEVLVQPLEMRFRYHFDGDKATNRIDRPEYFLTHVTTLLDDYSVFVADHIQPILLKRFQGTDLALHPLYIDASSAFITAVLPMLRTKISALLPKVARDAQLLSHLMHELMKFDTTIRDEWRYDGGFGVEGWNGLSGEFLVQGDWFGRWLQVEKDFALARYQSIIDAPDFGDLDYESVDPKATKPTKGAIRVNDLLETITDRYRPLTSFTLKLRFLIDIQIAIFDKLHERLQGSLDAYLRMTTSIGRAVGGITKEEQDKLLGVEGLERLCKTYGSADYLERAMRDWSDDVFFLDLWEELNDRARQAKNIGNMTIADVAERTSSAVGTDGDGDGVALFDETAGWYSRLRISSEKIISDTLNNNVREALRAYRHINPWASLTGPSASTGATLSPTAELDPLLSQLTTSLGFLSHALAPAPLRRITRTVLATISNTLWDNVLSRHRFSTSGAAQLRADLAAICRIIDGAVGPGVAEAGLRKCLEGVQLIGLPVKGGKSESVSTPAEEGDDTWDAWGGEDGGEPESPVASPAKVSNAIAGEEEDLGLWEVEKRLFADNQSAREVLEALGIESITEAEARTVLGRRVELAG